MKHYDYDQITIFDLTLPQFQIDRPIRLIELFAGIGSQAMALRDLGADFEHWRVVEFEPNAVTSYNAIHGTHFEPQDITKITGADLGIADTEKYCYIMTYSFPCQDLSSAGKGERHTVRAIMGSGTAFERGRQLAAGSTNGECHRGSRGKERRPFPGLDFFS